MNPYLRLDALVLWHIAGWTMVHFLWLGALIGILAAGCRLILRRASPNVRYLAATASLAILAALPLVIAGWLMQDPKTNVRLASSIAARGTIAEFTPEDVASSEANEPLSNVTALRSQVMPSAPGSAGGLPDGGQRFAGLNARPSRLLPSELRTWQFALIASWFESCIVYLPWIWFLGAPLTLALLATGIVGTERLRRASQNVVSGPLIETGARLAKSLRVGRRVVIATCDRVGAPMLVGILRPIILLPPAALTGWSPDEIEMVLLHELAHVRRWDNLMNLLQRLVESLLFFHPAVWLVSSWMRRDREACCDAIVVTCTRRPHAYAELLVALAAQMPRSVLFHPAASSAMAASPLRNRIRRILQLEDDSMLVTGKSFALVLAGLVTAATLAVLHLPTRGQAEESVTEVIENPEQSEEDAESSDFADEAVANETQTDPPTDQPESDAEDDWLRAADFASQKEREIAQRAWKELGFKAVPLTEAELEEVRRGGFRGGLKLIGLEEVMNTEGPLILTHTHSKRLNAGIANFDALERALDALASQPPDELLVLHGIKPRGGIFQYSMRRPQEKSARSTIADAPDADGQAKSESVNSAADKEPSRRVEVEQVRVGDENVTVVRGSRDDVNAFVKQMEADESREGETTDSIFVAYNVPQELIRIVETWAKLMNVRHGLSDKPGRFIMQAPADVHDRLHTLLDETPKWNDPTAAAERERDPVAKTIEQDGQRRVEWRTMGLTLGSPREVQRKSMQPRSVIGLEVIAVEPGSPGAWLTIQPNDTLTGISSFDTTSLSQLESMIKTLLDGSTRVRHTIRIVRSGGEQVATYLPQAASGTAPREPSQDQLRNSEPASKKRALFPSLEDQKLADLAYRRLNLELEPLEEKDSKRVKALGYDGGIWIAQAAGTAEGRFLAGDILVGLHVWPTMSLKDVAEILNREDLAELVPLKFYVIRRPPNSEKDVIVTGRIAVNHTRPQEGEEAGALAPARAGSSWTTPRRDATIGDKNAIQKLDGTVSAVQRKDGATLIEFSIGADDGLREGMTVGVYRGDKYLASVEVLATSPDRAVGRVDKHFDQGPISEGDRASVGIAQGTAKPQAPTLNVPPYASSQFSTPPASSESIGVLKRIVNREKQKYDRMAELVKDRLVTEAEAETQRADYEISMERLRQAERALDYYKAQVQLAAAEYEAALEASKKASGAVSELELRKLQLKLQAAEAKYKELAE